MGGVPGLFYREAALLDTHLEQTNLVSPALSRSRADSDAAAMKREQTLGRPASQKSPRKVSM